MYNVSYFYPYNDLLRLILFSSLNAVVLTIKLILPIQQNGIEQIHGGLVEWTINQNIFNIQ